MVSQSRTAFTAAGEISESPKEAPINPPTMQAFVSESPPLLKKLKDHLNFFFSQKGKPKITHLTQQSKNLEKKAQRADNEKHK